MKRYLFASVALSAAFLVLPTIALADVTNGSFEAGTDPGVFTQLNAVNNANIDGWTVQTGSVDYIGSYWNASNGSRSIDLSGASAGSISQVVPTVIGATYTVTFDLSGNPVGGPSLKEVIVSATGGTPQNFTYDTTIKGNTLSDMKWEAKSYTFVATSVSTTLTFASTIASAFGPALDNVSLHSGAAQCENSTTQTMYSDANTAVVGSGTAVAVPTPYNSAWTASIPGATWVWKSGPTADNETVEFQKSFTVSGTVLSAALDIAADNSYTVFIDGTQVAQDLAENNYSTTDHYNLTANVTPGVHTLRIQVTNMGVFNAAVNPAGLLYKFTVATDNCPPSPTPVQVYIHKYVDGGHATADNTNSAVFPMLTTFTSPNLGNYTDAPLTLSPTGWEGYGGPYEAWFIGSNSGANYTTHEVTTGNNVVGSSCADGKPFALMGYTTGDTLAAAAAATPSQSVPNFINLQSNHYVIVWNKVCTNLTVTPLVAYNPVNTSHTVTADIGIHMAGVPIVLDVTSGPDMNIPNITGTTDSIGIAALTYTNNGTSGTDTITVCVDENRNGVCDPGEDTKTVIKHWLSPVSVSGGGTYKIGRTVDWTFGGNVGIEAGQGVGQFELVDHVGKVSYHFNSFTEIKALSPHTISFVASGTQQGKTKSAITGVHFTITDNGEPGKNDTITVSGGNITLNTTPTISGGNFQVFVQ